MKKLFIALSTMILSSSVLADTLIPRSVAGDKGRYYLIEMKQQGNIVTATHKRVGAYDTYYTKTQTNCKTMKMRELGGSDVSAKAIKPNITKWFDLVPGSSKSDLAKFVCKQ